MSEAKPLQGLTVLNTRDARSAPALTERLAALGAQVVECPTIALVPPASWAAFDARLADLRSGDWIVFTSANAVWAALARLEERGQQPAVLGRGQVAAIGGSTRRALDAAGVSVTLVPDVAQQETLLEALLPRLAPGDRVWMPRAEEARAVLEQGLSAAGHAVSVTPVYRTVPPDGGLGQARELLLAGSVDWILFTSSSTVHHFLALLDGRDREALRDRWPAAACIGAVTAQTAREHGLPVVVVPAQQDLDGLLAALVAYVQGSGA